MAELRARQKPKTLLVSLVLVQKHLGNSWPRKSGMMFVSFSITGHDKLLVHLWLPWNSTPAALFNYVTVFVLG